MDFAEGKLKREDQACDMQTVIVIVLSGSTRPRHGSIGCRIISADLGNWDDDNLHGPA